MIDKMKYNPNLILSPRRKSRVVYIGHLPLGGDYPIRIQSMTNTDTNDTQATVEQCIRMADAGSEYIRITAQGVREAKNLAAIKAELNKRGYRTPLVADIHFNPKAAEEAAKHIEKVRINPGNYVDKYPKDKIEFTEEEYQNELMRIQERILPLIEVCKVHQTAMRIGTNHGSLSQRIMSRFGDSPQGMAESAMEFVRICHAQDYHQLVLSMKSSNIRVMVESTRLLVTMMDSEGMNYPIHLGVTEAGDGFEGRVKSAAGIGCLLKDGLGDTIRVSLTEDPEKELPIARQIVAICSSKSTEINEDFNAISGVDPFSFSRRETVSQSCIGGNQVPAVVCFSDQVIGEADFLWTSHGQLQATQSDLIYDLSPIADYKSIGAIDQIPVWKVTDSIDEAQLALLDPERPLVIWKPIGADISRARSLIHQLNLQNDRRPIILRLDYQETDFQVLSIQAAADTSLLLVDGLIDALGIYAEEHQSDELLDLSLRILQANGTRFSQTEFISCPSCGRTLFNIQQALAEVKSRTAHLKGLKIAVMGCVVNGPGEMADADYGYVGAGAGKVSLYKKKQQVMNNVPEQEAVDRLIDLIKSNGDWQDTPEDKA